MELRSDIEHVLEQCRIAVLGHVERLGLALQQSSPRLLINRDSPLTWTSEHVVESRNAFDSWSGELLDGAIGDEASTSVLDLANEIATSFATTLPYWAPFQGHGPYLAVWGTTGEHPTFEEDPRQWAAEHLVLPVAHRYLQDLDTLAKPSTSLLERLSSQLCTVAADTEWHVTASIPVAGLDTGTDVIESDLARVRRLSSHEQGRIAIERGFTDGHNPLAFRPLPSHVIELVSTMARDRQPTLGGIAWSVLAAFFLHGYELAGADAVMTRVDPKWLCPMTWGEATPLAHRALNPRSVDEQQLQQISDTAGLLDGYKLATPSTPRELALQRFVSGCTRTEPVDALLDFVIALESLLLPYDRHARTGDLAYRFRLHGAFLLAGDKEGRASTWDELTALYRTRSQAVHGSKYPTPNDAAKQSAIARLLAAKGLLRAVHNGFPNADDFRDLILRDQ